MYGKPVMTCFKYLLYFVNFVATFWLACLVKLEGIPNLFFPSTFLLDPGSEILDPGSGIRDGKKS